MEYAADAPAAPYTAKSQKSTSTEKAGMVLRRECDGLYISD
jgi:hypothetical protein